MEEFVIFKCKLKKESRSGTTCNLRRALLRYRSLYVGKEEGLFTCRAKSVVSCISVR